MIFKSTTFSAVLCCLLAPAVVAAELLQVTEYHGQEVKSKSGLIWLGLFPSTAGEYELKQTRVQITLVNDQIVDQPNAKTGKSISVSAKKQPLFLVRGISGLKTGKVTTCLVRRQSAEHLSCGQTLALKLRGTITRLVVSGSARGDILTGYALVLKRGGVRQTLYKEDQISVDGSPTLVWSGDLDGDGEVDLFMDMTNHGNVMKPTLFLSSKAKSGRLVEKVASLTAVGC